MKDFLEWLGVVLGAVAIWFTWYGIRDVRREVKRMLTIERNRVYVKLRSDLAWLFLEPTGAGHEKQLADLNEEFTVLALDLDPHVSAKDWIDFNNKQALKHANNLVENGYARYKKNYNPDAIEQALKQWQQEQVAERFAGSLLQEKKTWFQRILERI